MKSFRGQASLTIPSFDGPYKPNRALEHAPRGASAPDADNLIQVGDTVHFSSGPDRMTIRAGGAVSQIRAYGGEIAAVASTASGTVAVASGRQLVPINGDSGRPRWAAFEKYRSEKAGRTVQW
jgi:hypothetical protein